jgi:predicted metal-dependent hydrolase
VLPVTIVRKNIKYLRLRALDDGTFQVSAPMRVSERKIQEFIEANENWIEKQQKRMQTRVQREELYETCQLETEALKLVEYWKQRMDVEPARVRFRQMKTRWGVCNVESRVITFNLQLRFYPLECLEYVVVHELAHLKHRGHQKPFWDLVGQNLPNFKVLRKMLKE